MKKNRPAAALQGGLLLLLTCVAACVHGTGNNIVPNKKTSGMIVRRKMIIEKDYGSYHRIDAPIEARIHDNERQSAHKGYEIISSSRLIPRGTNRRRYTDRRSFGNIGRQTHETSTKAPTTSSTLAPHHSPTSTKYPTTILSHPSTRAPNFITNSPSQVPTMSSNAPTSTPTTSPSDLPSPFPSIVPTLIPTSLPSIFPSSYPTSAPSISPTLSPTDSPSKEHSQLPSILPTSNPTLDPSSKPSISLTLAPSLLPSTAPSNKPSTQPSDPPSSAPTVDLCKGVNGAFGDTQGENAIVVPFTYGVESYKNVEGVTKATLSEQVKGVKEELLGLLVKEFFPMICNPTNSINGRSLSRNNIFGSGGRSDNDKYFLKQKVKAVESPPQMESNSAGLVGIESPETDLANGRKCIGYYNDNPQYDVECNVINGMVTIFFSDMSLSSQTAAVVKKDIQSFMEDQLLKDTHPATLSVIYITESVTVARNVPDDDTDFEEETLMAERGPNMWMFASLGIVAAVALVAGTGYRYSTHLERDDFDNLAEVTDHSQNGRYALESRTLVEI